MLTTYEMIIYKYIPDRLYGFAQMLDSKQQVFFHLGVFDPGLQWETLPDCKTCVQTSCTWATHAPPPVTGEHVQVTTDLEQVVQGNVVPRATKVVRMAIQKPLKGTVKSFDNQRGYGFVVDSENVVHYIHKSEIVDHRIPFPAQTVMFFAGFRDSKSRACHVKVCS